MSFRSGEEMEFVEVNQDGLPDDTWDSFESFDFNDGGDVQQTNTGSAATSTTKNLATTSRNGKLQCVRLSTTRSIQVHIV